MSGENRLVDGEFIDHDESSGEELEVLHAEMTLIHSDFTSTVRIHEVGEEITAATLAGTSDQSTGRINV